MQFKKLPDLEEIEIKLSELHYIQLLDEARQEILTKGNNTVHYLKEIESRLSAGEEAAKKLVGLEKEVENLKKYKSFFETCSCLYAEGVEYMTRAEIYEAIKREVKRLEQQ